MVLQSSSEDETEEDPPILESSLEDIGSFGVMGNLFNHISTKLWQFLLLCGPTYMIAVRVICGHGMLRLSIWGLTTWGICSFDKYMVIQKQDG